jgi:hypothetical protein
MRLRAWAPLNGSSRALSGGGAICRLYFWSGFELASSLGLHKELLFHVAHYKIVGLYRKHRSLGICRAREFNMAAIYAWLALNYFLLENLQ